MRLLQNNSEIQNIRKAKVYCYNCFGYSPPFCASGTIQESLRPEEQRTRAKS